MSNTVWETERAWIEVNADNLRHNAETLKKAMQPGCELMAVVKAEGYGHGAVMSAKCLNEAGVTAFAVACIDEGIALRKSGVRGEILILGYTGVSRAAQLKQYDLMQTVIGLDYAKALNHQGIAVKVHIKIDTGMHRLGIPAGESAAVLQVFRMENLKVCGIFTHFGCSDSRRPDDIAFTERQIAGFYALIAALKESGVTIPKLHMQSSYGLCNYPDLACDYVRAGIALYGVLSSPGDDTRLKPDLRPALSLKSRVALIRTVKKGESVGYGKCFTAERDSRIAILPIGYGDGFPRSLSCGRGGVLINQRRCPIVGRVCMDSMTVDITDAGDVAVGNIAVLIGTQGEAVLPAPVVAEDADSISNELLCRMGTRLPVIFTRNACIPQAEMLHYIVKGCDLDGKDF